ncbi:selenocysteine-specific translation elongation factor [Tissierella sp. Yu-01]|uniref:selenocysteine-specific translation elongation factor n=1 Tax=Tissierella sp. Yu-01 TaxID=3035694 RepID=UPI00240E1C89|nr:selenocysteine-specific translation elongation factor [Tissierella sp. Yu-01]WFA09513.1 selenocysteine-specific translation elongation factor [Tissierella sp. Yu-01]
MKHVIIGTAGHIDHGKTTLIKALTGRNTDRLKEEQERGISIELGFTYFDLPGGKRAGIIDVPGHEKFIKNMLAGIIGIDIVLLVVAADEGIMPQTVEHLAILDLLGIKKGMVVITKTDLVDDEWLQLIEEDIRKEVKGTFLEDGAIIRVSSTKKTGINEVVKLVEEYSEEIEERNINDMPRLPIDRVFTVSGFGTVVTGTLLSGQFKVGDEIQIYPGEKKARIRTLQVHDEDANVAYGGQRVAVNLAGIKKEDVNRGSVIASVDSMKDSMMIDVKVKLLKSIDRVIENRTRLHLYIGTQEILCRIVLLDRDELNPGEETYAQLRLEEKIVSKRGDKFILRFYSPMYTIGGGIILEPNAMKKKRYDDRAIEDLRIKESGDSKEILEKLIQIKSNEFLSVTDISKETSMLEDVIICDINKLVDEGKVILLSTSKELYPIHIRYFDSIKQSIINEVTAYHKKFNLRVGIPKEELRSKIFDKSKPKVADQILHMLLEQRVIEQNNDLIKLSDFEIVYSKEQHKIKNYILEKLNSVEYLPPRKDDLAFELRIDRDEVEEVLNALMNDDTIIKINEEIILLTNSYDKALKLLKEHIRTNGNVTIGDFRDVLGTNRKVALGLLEYFDQLRITKRDGEKRTLTK